MKKKRQRAILELISSKVIITQEELQDALKEKGFCVTQATVSRDIKELRIVKALDSAGNYRYISDYKKTFSDSKVKFNDVFSNSVISIDYALNNVVIICHPGMASGACVIVDSLKNNDVLGTLAGDDTVLAITRNEKAAESLVSRLNELLR